MHMIIVGCGRVGSTLAKELSSEGHDVVIIDRDATAFRRVGENFTGKTITGIGFDRGVLTSAGITADSAVMAVTSGDNSNILIARVARELFGVSNVVARIYDPRRAAIYERLGISTVATVAWTSNRIRQTILPHESEPEWSDSSSTFQLVERRISAGLAGTTIEKTEANIVLLHRVSSTEVPASSTVLQQDDVVHILATAQDIAAFDAQLSGAATSHNGGHS
jgi:trk system potassium uptake protein TrkA